MEYYELLFRIIILPILALGFGILFGLTFKGIDRKLAAHMQARVGPPIRQPFRDVAKLFTKENIIPENSISWLFSAMPILCLVSAVSVLLYTPIGGFEPVLSGYGDLIVVLYLLALPPVCLVIGGFASGSPYATVGAQREMVMMMSYEFPLAVAIISVVWKLSIVYPSENVFSLWFIMSHPVWNTVGGLGFIGCAIILFVLCAVMPITLAKIPFDIPEAETEIAGGLLVEYSGKNLGLFYLADAVKTVAFASVVVALFFPYGIACYFDVSTTGGYVIDFIFFLVKLFIIIFIGLTFIRVAVARIKIDQVAHIYWMLMTIIGLVGLALIMIDSMGVIA